MSMTTIEFALNGRVYPIACPAADAPRIRDLGRQLQERAAKLRTQLGAAVTDAHLMVMLNLMMLDELSDAQSQKPAPVVETAPPAENKEDQDLMVRAVEHLTSRVISIAERLKAA